MFPFMLRRLKHSAAFFSNVLELEQLAGPVNEKATGDPFAGKG
jgi:hypothetical protein